MKSHLTWIALIFSLPVLVANAQDVTKPEGLLLRGFESEPLKNRRGFEAVENGVLTTVRVDAAEQISSTRLAREIQPHVEWYQQRAQKYLAYSVFDYATTPYLSDVTNSELYVVDVAGNRSDDFNIHQPDVFEAIVASAKAYVDIGVDGIEYDVDGWSTGLGSFDSGSLSSFNQWLTETKAYSASELESIFGSTVDAAFDYRSYLENLGVTADSTTLSIVNQTSHFRLWRGFVNYKERVTTEALIEQVNGYSQATIGRNVEFYFNRYGFFHTPSRRWNSITVDSGSLGETWFEGVDWLYENGHTLEPVYRVGLKSFDKRYESWNSPPNQSEAVQSVFLAATLANNGVATWEDDYPATAYIASFAYRFKEQLDHTPLSEVAIFYPHASVEHNRLIQANDEVLLGGQHYWYLGLGYLLAGINLNYDVLYAADGLVRDDDFETPRPEDYGVIFAAETKQITDKQFAALRDYVFAGGKLIVIGGEVFRYDELGRDQSSSRNLGETDYEGVFSVVGETAYGDGSVEVISLSQAASNAYSYHAASASIDIATIRSQLVAALPDGLKKIEVSGGDRLRVLSYTDDLDGSVILHLVNHGFNASGSALSSQANITVTLTLPSSVKVTPQASYVDASDGIVQSLAMNTNEDGSVSVNIPNINVWGILRLGSSLPETAMPNITPMAELSLLFNYEEFSSDPNRELDFQAADDKGLESVTFWYQKYDVSSEIWNDWAAGPSMALSGKRVDAQSNETFSVDFTELGEGRYRAQLIATDQEGASSALVPRDAYDTIVGFDISGPNFEEVSIEVLSGPENNASTETPEDVTLSISGVRDLISGVFQINSKFSSPSFDVAAETGETYQDGYTRTFTGPSEGQYGSYTISARAQDNAQNWSEWVDLYSYNYGIAPTITAATGSHRDSIGEDLAFQTGSEYSVSVGDSVNFEISFNNVLDDESVLWFKDGQLIAGQNERLLNLGSVSGSDSGTYYAVIENSVGRTQSDSFELLVVTPLRITDLSRSPSDGQVDQGGTFSLTVSAEGTGSLSYQWEAQILRADWALIEGATDSAYSVINATRAEHQGNYRVTVSDDNGSLLSERTLRIEVSQTTSGGGGTADDSDGDGIANGADNCPDVANLAQNDMNGDGEGDACDDDIDGDGAFNDEEAAAGTDPEDPESFPDDSGQSDRDGDGVEDDEDAFPLDASESLDTDSDGIGNNADLDDDNDNFTDEEELADGTDPLNRFSCRSGCFSFDVDESLKAQPLTDGLIVIRHLFGFSGDSLTSGAIDASAKRGTSELISTYLTNGGSELDIDGNGASEPLTDGLLLIRYLFGFSNDALISGAIGSGAERDTAEKVGAYIQDRVPEH